MHVELGLFDGDSLLDRGVIQVTQESRCNRFNAFHVDHRLVGESAQLVLSRFAPGIDIKTAHLNMPVHQSSDWESIDLAGYTLAFRCTIGAENAETVSQESSVAKEKPWWRFW